ncbi:hypothetical protein F511_08212 [Dorcoceras hygrometricum]|uniref:Fungal lipase-type domain-containing protein n=1 Tax=Dorcoceras hygrometricum TaxID=472368 RepID=A0A2Z7C5Q8_9LAMI|nr:hypothetical protein F511_08212 [Dorcoceras hygrometricum]
MDPSAECNKSFCCDYMLLKPEEASVVEVSKILFSSDVAKRKFLDCPEGERREPFGRRWIIFVSAMAQKALQAVYTPMAKSGDGVEYWLNLLLGNGGFSRLLINYFQDKVVYTEKTSSSFLSFVGHIDKRFELDSKIEHGDARYKAVLSVMASKVSYENRNYIQAIVENHWKMTFLGFNDFWNDYQQKATTQAFVLEDKNDLVVIAFRGTEPFDSDAWSSDVDLSWYELPAVGKVHGGFMKALGLHKSLGWPKEQPPNKPETAYYALRKLLKQRLQDNAKARFIVTGHSLGGALAALFPAILALHDESFLLERLDGVYTFGQPRVGDEKFGEFVKRTMEKYSINYYRFVYSYDVVPRLPYDDSTLLFKHFGTCIYYNSFYEPKIVPEEPDKNYFSLLWMIPKIANAWWELIRSFSISFTRGSEYKEGGVLRMFRVIGLFTAGVPAHCPQDYVNATRLGSSHVFLPTIISDNDLKICKIQ